MKEYTEMSNVNDFIIENDVLKKYIGPGGDVVIPDGVTKISKDAFWESNPIIRLSIPKGVTEIGAESFRDKHELMELFLPEGLLKIGSDAFNGCEKLKSLVVPSSLISIGRYAFRKCSNLTELYITDIASWCRVSLKDKYAHPLYESKFGLDSVRSYEYLLNRPQKDGCLFCHGELIRHLEIPEEIQEIGAFSFCNCSNIESVFIPKTVKKVGEEAFSGCSGIKRVLIDDIQNWCRIQFHFSSGTNPLIHADELICKGEPVRVLTVPDDITELGENTFEYCRSLTSVTIPKGVASISGRAFSNCRDLTSVKISEGVTSIGRYSFLNCISLTSAVIPDSVKHIGFWAFQGCEKLTSVTLPDKVETDPKQPPFEGCRLAVTVKHWTPEITKALKGCEITAIHTEALSQIPSTYRALAAFGFATEEKKNVNAPRAAEHMAYIRKNAGKLRNLMFTSKVALYFLCEQKLIGAKDYEAYLDTAVAQNDPEVKALMLGYQTEIGVKRISEARLMKDKAKEAYNEQLIQRMGEQGEKKGIEGLVFAVTGKLFSWSSRKVLQEYLEEYGAKLGSGVNNKTDYLVTDNLNSNSEKMLRARELGVEILTEKAFNKMVGKKYFEGEELILPDWLRRIEPDAFMDNKSVKRIQIPDHITEIPKCAFSGCSNLESVVLPPRVTKIGTLAFFDCRNLTVLEIPKGIVEIESCTFKFCHGLISVTIPDGVVHIGDQAFCGCSKLASVTLPMGVMNIDSWAFKGCCGLKDIIIPSSVIKIGNDAFKGCSNFTIHAPAGSFAEQYANKNNISFVAEE